MTNALTSFSNVPISSALVPAKPRESRSYLNKLQFVSTASSGLVSKGIPVGNFALVTSQGPQDLGDSVTIIPLVAIDKAVDFSSDEVESCYAHTDREGYDRIVAKVEADGYNSGCMYGPVFLVYETQSGEFLELFLNSKTTRNSAADIGAFAPVSEEVAAAHNLEARPPRPAELKSIDLPRKPTKSTRHRWKGFDVFAFNGELNISDPPTNEEVDEVVTKFVKQAELEPEGRDR